MSKKLKVTGIGNSTGATLPKELRVRRGDELMVHQTPEGILLSPFDAEFARQTGVAKKIMREDRDLLRRLTE